jgi:Type II/IV secretion system protein
MTQLVRTTLRMRPDRILVGEVRGPEALDLLMSWNTGHEGGIATLHANNAIAGLARLSTLVSMHPDDPRKIEPLIGEAVDVIVHIARTAAGRVVREILEVKDFDRAKQIYDIKPLPPKQELMDPKIASPEQEREIAEFFRKHGIRDATSTGHSLGICGLRPSAPRSPQTRRDEPDDAQQGEVPLNATLP